MANLYVALLHGEVIDKTGREIASALTHFDVHDIARTCRSYGVTRYFVVTPLETMRYLAQRMVSYWKSGLGSHTIPNRTEALELVEVSTSLDEAVTRIEECERKIPTIIATSARQLGRTRAYDEVNNHLTAGDQPVLVLFGTAYGLSQGVLDRCDALLPPIRTGHWNHLSVRSAVAITLDRLLGESRTN